MRFRDATREPADETRNLPNAHHDTDLQSAVANAAPGSQLAGNGSGLRFPFMFLAHISRMCSRKAEPTSNMPGDVCESRFQ